MNQEAIHYIMQRMSGWLDNRQMVVLQNTLDESVKLTEDREAEKTTAELLDAFIATKRLEGRSEGTIELYLYNIRVVLIYSEKNACIMTTDDIRQCLVRYQEDPNALVPLPFPFELCYYTGVKCRNYKAYRRFAGGLSRWIKH